MVSIYSRLIVWGFDGAVFKAMTAGGAPAVSNLSTMHLLHLLCKMQNARISIKMETASTSVFVDEVVWCVLREVSRSL